MSTTSTTPKVLIVGAGPVGLLAALILLRNGVPVRIIEKSTTPRMGQRGAGISPRTIEIFESLGFMDKFMKGSIATPTMRMYKLPGGTEVLKDFVLNPVSEASPDRPYPNMRLLGQEVLDRISQSELKEKYGQEIDLGVELRHLEQAGEKVHVKLQKGTSDLEEAAYDYVIGADGAKGVVRKLLGLTFLGETREQTLMVGDFILEGLSDDFWHMWGDSGQLLVRGTETKGLFNFLVLGINPEDPETDEAFVKTFKELTGGREDIKIVKIIFKSFYRVNIRMVDSYRKGNVFVAGDAAHVHSPAGGQGLNTGVQDSYNLGWKLALVIKGLAPPSLLDTYNDERLRVASEVLQISTALISKSVTRSEVDRKGGLKQLGVNYRSSSIVVDDGAEKKAVQSSSAYGDGKDFPVYAGDRAPDAPGLRQLAETDDAAGTRLFHLLDPTRHTVLVFSEKLGTALQPTHSVFSRYPVDLVRFVLIAGAEATVSAFSAPVDVYRDRDGYAHHFYEDPNGSSKIFVVRPDGYVGARLTTLDRVEAYFKLIFGDCV